MAQYERLGEEKFAFMHELYWKRAFVIKRHDTEKLVTSDSSEGLPETLNREENAILAYMLDYEVFHVLVEFHRMMPLVRFFVENEL